MMSHAKPGLGVTVDFNAVSPICRISTFNVLTQLELPLYDKISVEGQPTGDDL
jgi:hypothetical protein